MIENRIAELTRPSGEFPRRFLSADLTLTGWADAAKYYQELEERAIGSVVELEQWILDGSELSAFLGEESSRRYIAMTCATDDEAAERSFMQYVEEIAPKQKEAQDRLNRKLVQSEWASELPARYEIYLRSCRNAVELFREVNIPIETEVERLSQQYQKVFGSMTVEWQGAEITIPRALAMLEETDRDVREKVYALVAERRLRDRDVLEDVFDEMVAKRHEIALNAGFENYRDYKFREYERFDYTPADCEAYHRAVESLVVPVVREAAADRKRALGVSTLRPWDMDCDPFGREPLHPFSTSDELIRSCSKIFHALDSELGTQFDKMNGMGLLDLSSRKGKAPGGYQSDLAEVRLPFIFMNAVGTNDDVFTLLHEGGHAFHNFAVREEPIHSYRHAPMEFSEVASMSMELLAMPYLSEFFSVPDQARTIRFELAGKIALLAWVATIDAFQHWVYTHPKHTREERRNYWRSLVERFGAGADHSGFEEARDYRWHAQLHIFEVPFYYIEYGIAQLGAMQIWTHSRTNAAEALRNYKHGLSLGGSRPLPKLYQAAGIKLDFSPEMIAPLMSAVRDEMSRQGKLEKHS
ncbi:MAG: M3 family oligoendopeptidase [Calditrichaeota bacterium]|nr:M3 family oligoendopeptidase [Calditrichota bacterium]